MIPILIFTLTFVLAGGSTFAASSAADSACTDTRLDNPDGPLASIPIYNQKKFTDADVNICWAITTAELIDAYRAKHEGTVRQLTSPLSIALEVQAQSNKDYLKQFSNPNIHMAYAFSKPDLTNSERAAYTASNSVVGSGEVAKGMAAIRDKNVCDQRFLGKLIDMAGDQTTSATKAYLQGETESVHDYFYSVLELTKAKREALVLTSTIANKIAQGIGSGSPRCASGLFANVASLNDSLVAAVKADPLGNYTAVDVLAFTNQYCHDHQFAVRVPSAKALSFKSEYGRPPAASPEIIVQQIHRQLSSGQPVGIDIKACLLGGTAACSHPVGNMNAAHAILISGQRKNTKTNSCEYLLRNSYGNTCADQNGKPKYPWPCENGSIWVDEQALMSNAEQINWLPAD